LTLDLPLSPADSPVLSFSPLPLTHSPSRSGHVGAPAPPAETAGTEDGEPPCVASPSEDGSCTQCYRTSRYRPAPASRNATSRFACECTNAVDSGTYTLHGPPETADLSTDSVDERRLRSTHPPDAMANDASSRWSDFPVSSRQHGFNMSPFVRYQIPPLLCSLSRISSTYPKDKKYRYTECCHTHYALLCMFTVSFLYYASP